MKIQPVQNTLFLIVLFVLAGCAPAPAAPAVPAVAVSPNQPATPQPSPTASPVLATPAAGKEDIREYVIDPSTSFASYEVGEVFLNQNNRYNLAVGKTSKVSGSVFLNFTQPQKSTTGPIEVDISLLQSDSAQRDNAIRGRWLESAKFPLARFKPTEVQGLPGQYTEGSEITFQMTGDLTIHDTSKPVTFTVKAKLSGSVLTGSATAEILMADFNVTPPNILGAIKAEDKAKLNLVFTAKPPAG